MKSFVKLPKVLLTATLFRGRNRLSRLVVLAILMGIMYAGFWLSQQKQHTRERIAIAPGDEEIMKVGMHLRTKAGVVVDCTTPIKVFGTTLLTHL